MRTLRLDIYNLTYTIDLPVLFLFFGVILDIISTSLFVVLDVGREANFILKELIPISIWFIPIYLFSTNALFIPFLSKVLRKTFSYTFGIVTILFALNNFSLVIFNNAFLVDAFGYNNLLIIYFLYGLTIFVYFVNKEKLNKKEIIFTCLKLFMFLLFLVLIHSLFIIITWPAFF